MRLSRLGRSWRNVPDYALMVGCRPGMFSWISRHGLPLKQPDASGVYTCRGLRYREIEPGTLLPDLHEDASLPDAMRVGSACHDGTVHGRHKRDRLERTEMKNCRYRCGRLHRSTPPETIRGDRQPPSGGSRPNDSVGLWTATATRSVTSAKSSGSIAISTSSGEDSKRIASTGSRSAARTTSTTRTSVSRFEMAPT